MPTDDFRHDMNRAFGDFQRIVVSQWGWLQKQTIRTIEDKYDNQTSNVDDIAAILDRDCGIDALIKTETGWAGLALRTQEDGHNWRTFTIRQSRNSNTKTEFEKLCEAIDSHGLYPKHVIQSYIEDSKLLGAAFGDVEEIIQFIRNHPDHEAITRSVDNARFFFVPWDELETIEYVSQTRCKMRATLNEQLWPGLTKQGAEVTDK